MLKKTPLNALHREKNARLVSFCGWELPLNYGSQIEEHHAVRRGSGVFDVSHMCLVDVAGQSALPFLSHLLANDVTKLRTVGRALYSMMLNEQGGVIDDLIVYRLADDHFRLVLNAACAEKDLAWMLQCKTNFAADVAFLPCDNLAMIAVQGPLAKEHLWKVLPKSREATTSLLPFHAVSFEDYFIATTGYTGESGFEIMLPAKKAPELFERLCIQGVIPCGLGARDTLRLEAGMSLYGQEMDEKISPLDAGLGWTVAMKGARDFIGKNALQSQGQKAILLGLVLEDKGVLRAGQKVLCAAGEGIVTSGTFSPTLQKSIALARLPMGMLSGDKVQVDIRGKSLPALVVAPPFVAHRKTESALKPTTKAN